MFSFIWTWINGWVNNREAGDLRRHRTHYDVIVMATKRGSGWFNVWFVTKLSSDAITICGNLAKFHRCKRMLYNFSHIRDDWSISQAATRWWHSLTTCIRLSPAIIRGTVTRCITELSLSRRKHIKNCRASLLPYICVNMHNRFISRRWSWLLDKSMFKYLWFPHYMR